MQENLPDPEVEQRLVEPSNLGISAQAFKIADPKILKSWVSAGWNFRSSLQDFAVHVGWKLEFIHLKVHFSTLLFVQLLIFNYLLF